MLLIVKQHTKEFKFLNMTTVTNKQQLWKAIEQNKISHSVAHYLMAMDMIIKELHYCKSADIARKLQVSRNAVSLRLKPLVQMDLVYIDKNKKIFLTEQGKIVVNDVISARKVIKRFLTGFLYISDEVAEKDSCKVEHLISEQTRTALLKLMQFVDEQPQLSQQFINSLADFSVHCKGKAEPCPLCHSQCILQKPTDTPVS